MILSLNYSGFSERQPQSQHMKSFILAKIILHDFFLDLRKTNEILLAIFNTSTKTLPSPAKHAFCRRSNTLYNARIISP
jgi:hypothetical protein